jgi:hypothetical protein
VDIPGFRVRGQAELDVLQYTIPISLEIVPYQAMRRRKVSWPAANRGAVENLVPNEVMDVETIWRKVVTLDAKAFLRAGIGALKNSGALEVHPGCEVLNSRDNEFLYLPGFGGLRLAAMAA